MRTDFVFVRVSHTVPMSALFFSLLSLVVVADGNLARSGTVPTMPRRICDVRMG